MSTFAGSEACDERAPQLSAFLDGELPFPGALPAIDHLAVCEPCRRFYVEARHLSERLVAPAPEASEEIWRGVAVRATGAHAARGPRAPRRWGRPGRKVWTAGLAAAMALLAVGVLVRRPSGPSAPPGGSTVPSVLHEIVVEGARGRMTDDRFVSLLAELLSADRKYHRETERVLRLVLEREANLEPGDSDAAADTENDETEEPDPGKESPHRAARLPS